MTVFERTKETAKQKGLSLVALEERAGLSENLYTNGEKVTLLLKTSKK